MAVYPTPQDLENAKQDLDNVAAVANGPESGPESSVALRLGGVSRTVRKAIADLYAYGVTLLGDLQAAILSATSARDAAQASASSAQTAAAIAQAAQRVYASSAAGASDTTVPAGGYFYVIAAEPNVFELWLKTGAGTATDTTRRYPSALAVATPIALAQQYLWAGNGLSNDYPEWIEAGWSGPNSTGTLYVERVSIAGVTTNYERVNMEQFAALTTADIPLISAGFLTPAQEGLTWANTGLSDDYPLWLVASVVGGVTYVLEVEAGNGVTIFASVEGAGGGGGQVGTNPVPDQGIHHLRLGQSNEDGRAEAPYTAVSALVGKFYDYVTDTIQPWIEPHLRISTAERGTRYGVFINEFYRRTGLLSLVTNGSEGGTPMVATAVVSGRPANEYWASGGSLLPRAIARGQAALAKAAATNLIIKKTIVHFTQGEADAAVINGISGQASLSSSEEAWFQGFSSLVTDIRAAFGPKTEFLMYQLGFFNSVDSAGYQAIRRAIARACREIPGVHMAFAATPNFATTQYVDDVHWNRVLQNNSGAHSAVTASNLV